MNVEEQKRLAAQQAVGYVEEGSVVGVGTGSTVAHFIDELGKIRGRIEATVSSSEKSTVLLKQLGIPGRAEIEPRVVVLVIDAHRVVDRVLNVLAVDPVLACRRMDLHRRIVIRNRSRVDGATQPRFEASSTEG